MIQEKRLKELLLEKATIYFAYNDISMYDIAEKEVIPVKLTDKDYIYDNILELDEEVDGRDIRLFEIVNIYRHTLYENEKDAIEVLYYKDMFRIEKLSLLTFEELQEYFKESDYYSIRFSEKATNVDKQYLLSVSKKYVSFSYWVDGEKSRNIMEAELTRDNYITAKTLFRSMWERCDI